MKLIFQVLMFIVCVCFFGIKINAQTKPTPAKPVDARIEKALKQAQISYELQKDGGYKVTLNTPGSRHQNAFITSSLGKLLDGESRVIFSYAAISDHPPSPETANLLLERNIKEPGAWAILKLPDGKFGIVYLIYLRADADTVTLVAALQIVTEAADKMEKQLTAKDEL